MRVIKIKRVIRKEHGVSRQRRLIFQFARDFFAGENHLEFAIEALLFGALLALLAGPLLAVAEAINQIL